MNDRIRRSTLSRFLPASILGLIVPMVVLGSRGLSGLSLALFSVELLALTLGYAVSLKLGESYLPPEKTLTGWRAVLAGAIAPLTAAIPMAFLEGQFGSTAAVFVGAGAICVATGGYLGAMMFLRPRRSRERKAVAELPGESLEQWLREVERESALQ